MGIAYLFSRLEQIDPRVLVEHDNRPLPIAGGRQLGSRAAGLALAIHRADFLDLHGVNVLDRVLDLRLIRLRMHLERPGVDRGLLVRALFSDQRLDNDVRVIHGFLVTPKAAANRPWSKAASDSA